MAPKLGTSRTTRRERANETGYTWVRGREVPTQLTGTRHEWSFTRDADGEILGVITPMPHWKAWKVTVTGVDYAEDLGDQGIHKRIADTRITAETIILDIYPKREALSRMVAALRAARRNPHGA